MKHFFSFFTAIFFLISCSKNEEETQNVQNNDPLITKMNLSVLNQNSQVNNQTDPHLYFQYDSQNRLTKKSEVSHHFQQLAVIYLSFQTKYTLL